MKDNLIEPIDYCGCGDIGYLKKKNLPIALNHGVGQILNVPVYSCRDPQCSEYKIPDLVSRRIDEIAEAMENSKALSINFNWASTKEINIEETTDDQSAILFSFTLQFQNRKYEDAEVVYILPGEIVILRGTNDVYEYFILRLEEIRPNGIWFTLSKFYYEAEIDFSKDIFELLETIQTKELANLLIDEVEEIFEDEFGEIII